jgi:hypothetical protein
MVEEKICVTCGREFEPTCHKVHQKFCSTACRIKYNNAKRYFGGQVEKCLECGAPVEQTGSTGRWRRYCSDHCREEYSHKKAQERRMNAPRPKLMCPNCGKEFEPEWGHLTNRRFCCDACRLEWWKEYHKAHPKDIPSERKCTHCGKEFSADRWHGGEYCSRACYLAAMAETRVTTVCQWCGDEFSALASSKRKYCSIDCAAAARSNQAGFQKGRRRISYQTPEEWREQIRLAAEKSILLPKRGKRVWLVCGDTSMNLGVDGMLARIRYEFCHNPFDGAIYVFCDMYGITLKYLEWDGMGFCLTSRKTQSGRYPWPPEEAGPLLEISEREFEYLKSKSIVPFKRKKQKQKPAKSADNP